MKTIAFQLKILIVDGSKLVLERLSGMVSEAGCVSSPVLISNSFPDAIRLINSQLPDVLLLDIQLPENKGFELLEHVFKFHPKIRTVVVTNNADHSYKERCIALGAVDFIDKSTEFEKIPSVIDSFCNDAHYIT